MEVDINPWRKLVLYMYRDITLLFFEQVNKSKYSRSTRIPSIILSSGRYG